MGGPGADTTGAAMLLWEAGASGPQLQHAYTDGAWVPVLGTHYCVLTLPLVLGRPHPHRLLAVSSATPQASWTVGTVSTSQLPLSPSVALGGFSHPTADSKEVQPVLEGGSDISAPEWVCPNSTALLSPYCLTSRLHHSGLVTCPLALGLSLPF